MEQSYLTLPTAEQLGHHPHLISDFGIALGAKCSTQSYEIDGQVGKAGVAWTCESSGVWNGADFCPSQDYVKTVNCNGRVSEEYAGRQNVCIMPRIVNPDALGFNIVKVKNSKQEFVTLQGRLVTLPKTAVTDKVLESRLFRAYKDIEGTVVKTGEHLVNGNYVNLEIEVDEPLPNLPCRKMALDRFKFEGKDYVYLPESCEATGNDSQFRNGKQLASGRWYFFVCEPYQATREPDGCLQFQEMILPMPYETQNRYRENHATNENGELVNLANYNIGQYLNRALLKEMCQSVGLEINQNQQQTVSLEKN